MLHLSELVTPLCALLNERTPSVSERWVVGTEDGRVVRKRLRNWCSKTIAQLLWNGIFSKISNWDLAIFGWRARFLRSRQSAKQLPQWLGCTVSFLNKPTLPNRCKSLSAVCFASSVPQNLPHRLPHRCLIGASKFASSVPHRCLSGASSVPQRCLIVCFIACLIVCPKNAPKFAEFF